MAMISSIQGLAPGKLLFVKGLPTSIHDPAFRGDVLRRTLDNLILCPSDIVFELSEKQPGRDPGLFRVARKHDGELGFQVAIDDTGLAYRSLDSIIELAPDFIRVDLNLVRGIDADPARQERLRALNVVANSIHASVIAEGIETSDEPATVQSLGVTYG